MRLIVSGLPAIQQRVFDGTGARQHPVLDAGHYHQREIDDAARASAAHAIGCQCDACLVRRATNGSFEESPPAPRPRMIWLHGKWRLASAVRPRLVRGADGA